MKVRSDFVTNSSSSSFTVTIIVTDKNDKKYEFYHGPIDHDNIDIGPVDLKHGVEKKIKNAQDMNSLLDLLKNATENYTDNEFLGKTMKDAIDEFPEYKEKIEQVEKRKEEFIKKLEENIKDIDDIKKVTIVKETSNTGECIEYDFSDWEEILDETITIDMVHRKITKVDDRDKYR